MSSQNRQCPRCQTINPRALTNCSQCGAVMLGVASVDVADLVASNRPDSGGTAPSRSEKQQELVRLARQAIALGKPVPKASGVGCAGCLLRMLVAVVLAVASAVYLIAEKNPEQGLDELLQTLGKKLERALDPHREVPPPRPPLPVMPRSLPMAPVAPPPELMTPTEEEPKPEVGRHEEAMLHLWEPSLAMCARMGAPARPALQAIKLRLTFGATGRLTKLLIVVPDDIDAKRRRCVQAVYRAATIDVGEESQTIDYDWQAEGR